MSNFILGREYLQSELEDLLVVFGLRQEDVETIEQEIIEKSQADREACVQNLKRYEKEFRSNIDAEYPLSDRVLNNLNDLQQSLGLNVEDIEKIERPILTKKEATYQQKIKTDLLKQKQEQERLKREQEELEHQRNLQQHENDLSLADQINESTIVPVEADPMFSQFVAEQDVLKEIKVPKKDDASEKTLAERVNPSKSQLKKSYIISVAAIATIASIAGYTFWQQAESNKRLSSEIEMIKSLKVAGKYQACIDISRGISTSSIYATTAQSLLKECQNGLSEIEGKKQLIQAQKLAKEDKLEESLAIATKINASTTAYKESQQLIEQLAVTILERATKQYQEQGKLNESIAMLQEIPANIATAKKVKELTAKWQAEWKMNETTLSAANKALNESRWNDAITESKKVTTPYWQKQTEAIVQKANESLVPVSTPVQQPQPTYEPQPVYEPQPTYSSPPQREEPRIKIDLAPVNTGK